MIKKALVIFLLSVFAITHGYSQSIESLRQRIESVIDGKKAVAGIAITGPEHSDTLSINGRRHFPMQSVFKFPIALTVLSEIDKGNYSLDQKIEIKKSELLPGLWSPIRKKYPEGATLTIAEILKYTVALSDNVGCDAMLKLLGEPQAVEQYFSSLGFTDFAVKINEETMQNNWDM